MYVPACMAVLCEFWAAHSCHRLSVEHGGLRPPPFRSSHPNNVARFPPAMCDRFASPSPLVWPDMKGRSNLRSLQPIKLNHNASANKACGSKSLLN